MYGLRMATTAVAVAVLVIATAGIGPLAEAAELDSTAPVGSSEGFLEALALVPDTLEARQSMLSYLDQEAVAHSRPGSAKPDSLAGLQALRDAGDPSAAIWLAAFMGVNSGDPDLLRHIGSADTWPEVLGFDLLDIDRQLVFGQPPTDGTVLLGTFDQEAITRAFAQRSYSSTVAGSRTLLCGPGGCDGGLSVDLANLDQGLPFGAALGRSEPLAVSSSDILQSAELETLKAMMASAVGEAASLADDPASRAVADAASPEAMLVQATLLPGGMLGLGPDIYRSFAGSPEEAGALVVELDEMFESMPAADLVAILDGATPTEQVVTVALAYADEADAAAAADILPQRLATLPLLSREGTLADLLTEAGVTSVNGSVMPGGEGASAVARIEIRAPLAGDVPDSDGGGLATSSAVYRALVNLVMRRDVLWLAPVLPLE